MSYEFFRGWLVLILLCLFLGGRVGREKKIKCICIIPLGMAGAGNEIYEKKVPALLRIMDTVAS